MTLFEYLNTIKPDYLEPELSMIVVRGNVPDQLWESSRGRPFIRVVEGPARIRKRYSQGFVLSKIVRVSIFQAADSDGKSPEYDKITDVWNRVLLAGSFVDENTYGDNLISVRCVGGQPPEHHVNSGGLAAEVEFAIEFGREI